MHVHYGWNKGICGGTIIDDETILSAAHCFHEPNDLGPQSEFIEAGIRIDQAPLGQDIFVKKIIKHPNFDKQTLKNDIAILKLATPLQFNSRVKPACLPNEDQTAEKGFVSDWGRFEDSNDANKENSMILRFYGAKIMTNENCVLTSLIQNLTTESGNFEITKNVVCAYADKPGDEIKEFMC